VNENETANKLRRLLSTLSATALVVLATAQIAVAQTGNADAVPLPVVSVVFEDITRAAGLGATSGGSVAWRDIDGDRVPDLAVTSQRGQTSFFTGNGSEFADVPLRDVFAATAGPGIPVFVDIDGDGDGDLTIFDVAGDQSQMLENVDGDLTSATAATGEIGPTTGGYWVDVDNDGLLDVFLSGPSEPVDPGVLVQRSSVMLRAEIESFEPAEPQTLAVLHRDASNGELELLTGGARFPAHQFFLGGSGPSYSSSSMGQVNNAVGVLAGDLDGDQIEELLILRSDNSDGDLVESWDTVLERSGDTWVSRRPFPVETNCRYGALVDFDNDGDLDAFLACGTDNTDLPERLFINNGRGEFAEQTLDETVGEGIGGAAAVTVVDFDGDGYVDVLLSSDSGVQLLRNATRTEASSSDHWLAIDLVGDRSNTDGIGAVVTVVADGSTSRRDQRGGQHSGGQDDRLMHFGVGGASTIDRIVVLWPTGRRQIVDDVPADQVLVLTEPASDDDFADIELARIVFDPVVETGERTEIRVDATNVGIGVAVGTVIEFELPAGWVALGLPDEVSVVEPGSISESSPQGTIVRWPLVDLDPGQIARLSLAVEAGAVVSDSLTVTAVGPFPTQRITRDVLTTERARGLGSGLMATLAIVGTATIAAAVFLTVRRARNDEVDLSWYETATDLSAGTAMDRPTFDSFGRDDPGADE
jgi:hypothetical protein